MIGRPNETTIRQRAWALVEPVCLDAGYEVVDVRFVTEQSGWVLRVLIDALPIDEHGEPLDPSAAAAAVAAPRTEGPADGDIDLSDCERVARELSAVLDVDETIAVAYSLEVSSPGIDRPLVTEPHFRRYVGAEIKATLHRGVATASIPGSPAGSPSSERKNFRGLLVGVEGAGKDAAAKVIVDGQPWLLPIDDVDQARILPDWDAVMKGGRGQIRTPAAPPAKAGPRARQHHPGSAGPAAPSAQAKGKAKAKGPGKHKAATTTQTSSDAPAPDDGGARTEPAQADAETTSPRRDDKPAP